MKPCDCYYCRRPDTELAKQIREKEAALWQFPALCVPSWLGGLKSSDRSEEKSPDRSEEKSP